MVFPEKSLRAFIFYHIHVTCPIHLILLYNPNNVSREEQMSSICILSCIVCIVVVVLCVLLYLYCVYCCSCIMCIFVVVLCVLL